MSYFAVGIDNEGCVVLDVAGQIMHLPADKALLLSELLAIAADALFEDDDHYDESDDTAETDAETVH